MGTIIQAFGTGKNRAAPMSETVKQSDEGDITEGPDSEIKTSGEKDGKTSDSWTKFQIVMTVLGSAGFIAICGFFWNLSGTLSRLDTTINQPDIGISTTLKTMKEQVHEIHERVIRLEEREKLVKPSSLGIGGSKQKTH